MAWMAVRPLHAALLLCSLGAIADAQRAPRLERLVTIGCDDCGDSRAFTEIVDVAVTAQGVIWVADRTAPKLRAFKPDGSALRAFGAHGRGPGEIWAISRLFVSGTTLTALDPLTLHAARFDTLGKSLGSQSLGRFPMDASVAANSAGLVLLTSEFKPGSSTVEHMAPGAATFTRQLGPLSDFPSATRPGEAHALAVAPDGRIALTEAGAEYRIAVYERDGRRRDIARDLPRTKYTADEHAAMERRRARGNQLRNAEATRGGGPGPTPPPPTEKPHLTWAGLRFDASGNLWVLTGRGMEGEAVVDVYDRELRLLGEVRIPAVVTRIAVGDGYLATAGEDRDGMPVVTIWRIVP
jgi:hypothetical protein